MATPSFQPDQDWELSADMMASFWLYYAQGHIENKDAMLANNHTSASFKSIIGSKYFNYDSLPKDFFHKGYIKMKPNYGDDKLWNELKDVFLNPEFAPLVSNNLAGLPPAYIYTSHGDVLRDDGVLYAQKLKAAKVEVQHTHSITGFHAVLALAGEIPESQSVFGEIAEFFRSNV